MKTDTHLRQDVGAELQWEPAANSTQIGIAVEDGVVTLTGEVGSLAEKWNVERAAQRVAGVKDLVVDLKVAPGGTETRSDTDIARSAQGILECSICLPRDAIRIRVEDGHVTLAGQVNWQHQRLAAEDAVRLLLGVTGVNNEISLKPNVAATDVKDQIVAALRRGAYAEADAIHVHVQGAEVTLSGTVRSSSQRDLATQSAWGSPGVRNVVDQLVLLP